MSCLQTKIIDSHDVLCRLQVSKGCQSLPQHQWLTDVKGLWQLWKSPFTKNVHTYNSAVKGLNSCYGRLTKFFLSTRLVLGCDRPKLLSGMWRENCHSTMEFHNLDTITPQKQLNNSLLLEPAFSSLLGLVAIVIHLLITASIFNFRYLRGVLNNLGSILGCL